MRAFLVETPGAQPRIAELETPAPGPGQFGMKIHACGLNFADLLMVSGTYQDTPPTPFTLGMEVSGEVTAIGENAGSLSIGDRIAVFAGQGGLAEFGVFDAHRAIAIPDSMSFEHAAAIQITYGTAHVALSHRAKLQPGETLLVTGAAGGAGLTAVEIGKVMGARVIAQARTTEKLAVAQQAGADHLIDGSADLRQEVLGLGGADVVYDTVGGDLFKAAFRAANPEARLLPIGFAGGDVPQIAANHLLVKNISVLGVYFGGYLAFQPEIVRNSLSTLLDWYKQGRIKPHISHVLPLDRAQEGLDLLRNRTSTGKVVIAP